jgi:hypothetical protein
MGGLPLAVPAEGEPCNLRASGTTDIQYLQEPCDVQTTLRLGVDLTLSAAEESGNQVSTCIWSFANYQQCLKSRDVYDADSYLN